MTLTDIIVDWFPVPGTVTTCGNRLDSMKRGVLMDLQAELPNDAERRIARHESLKKGGTLRYCYHCGEYIILVAGCWEADGLNVPYCYDLDARLTCENSSCGHHHPDSIARNR